MKDEIYSVDAVDNMVAQLVELHSITLGMMAGPYIRTGAWTEEEAVSRLRQIAEDAQFKIAKTCLGAIADAVERGDGPHLTVIDGGKT